MHTAPTTPPTTLFPLPPKYNFKGEISFTTNWNKKLYCHFFTTIRLYNLAKYHVGSYYKINIDGHYSLDVKLVDIKYCLLNDLPEYTCFLDTGYSKTDTIDLFKKMYAAKNINWETQKLCILLMEHLDWEKPR